MALSMEIFLTLSPATRFFYRGQEWMRMRDNVPHHLEYFAICLQTGGIKHLSCFNLEEITILNRGA